MKVSFEKNLRAVLDFFRSDAVLEELDPGQQEVVIEILNELRHAGRVGDLRRMVIAIDKLARLFQRSRFK